MVHGRLGKALVTVGLVPLLGSYGLAPLAGVFAAPRSADASLTAVAAPTLAFPAFKAPKPVAAAHPRSRAADHTLRAAQKLAAAAAATQPTRRLVRVVRHTVATGPARRTVTAPKSTIVTDQYSAPGGKSTAPTKDPLAGVPEVDDNIGAISTTALGSASSGQSPSGSGSYSVPTVGSLNLPAGGTSTSSSATRAAPAASSGSAAAGPQAGTDSSSTTTSTTEPTLVSPSSSAPARVSTSSTAPAQVSPATPAMVSTAPVTTMVTVSAPVVTVVPVAPPPVSDALLQVATTTLSDATVVGDTTVTSVTVSGPQAQAQPAPTTLDAAAAQTIQSSTPDVGGQITTTTTLDAPSAPAPQPVGPTAATPIASGGATGTGSTGGAADLAGNASPAVPPAGDLLAPTSSDQISTEPSVLTAGRGPPPAGSVLILAARGGTVSAGAATLTFAPGSLPSDAYVLITPVAVSVSGLVFAATAYDLQAIDAATGAVIEHFNSAPVLTIGGAGQASRIYYLDPANGPQAIGSSYDAATGAVTAALPHFSLYVLGSSFTVDVTATGVTVTGTAPGHTLQVGPDPSGVRVTDTTTPADTFVFAVPTGSLTINAPGESVELLAGMPSLGSAILAVTAQNITVHAGAALTAAAVTLNAVAADSSASTIGATLTASAHVVVDGTITATGALVLSAAVSHTIALTGQTLASDLTYTLASTSVAEVRSGGAVSAGSLQILATTTTHFTWSGVDPSVSYTDNPSDPDGINGAVRLDATDLTHAGVAAGGKATVTGPAASSALVRALDDAEVAITIIDTTDYGTLTAITTTAFLQFGRILSRVNLSRDTQAYLAGTPASGNTLSSAGGATVEAHDTGSVAATITSDLLGKVEITVSKDDALAFVTGAHVAVTGLTLNAITDTAFAASAKVARNTLTGNTKATTATSGVTAGAGGVSQAAHDQTVLSATATHAIFESLTPLVVLTSTEALNSLTRSTEASVTGSTITVTGGDLGLHAVADGHVLAWAQSTSVKVKNNNRPPSSAKGFAGTFSANMILGGASAFIAASAVSAHDIAVDATNGAFIDATSEIAVHTESPPDFVSAGTGLLAPGDMAIGASMALNFIGWSITCYNQLALAG
ncbi:MAG: hypothetical protein JWN32_3286, partial [Solirubrobacterales bacterium]|nr:hypothetical protein [Solirubrobacterales bacterium]